ncbi:PREDICTED: melanoma-associated antigen B4-like [Elephantulus edwardii]|uniref:melanoma-associated antigen B4-like n=1 Tax=Elephantulus edwardii TaxID=28737 RepID=UPI0003F0B454|nr:PREDICTED: melanoma-associated antigen B4-like [Elephantulus edwardii]
MPRGQKSKNRAREKRQQAREDTYVLEGVQDTAAAAEVSSSPRGASPQRRPDHPTAKGPQRPPSTPTAAAGASCTGPDEGTQGQDGASARSSKATTKGPQRDPLDRRISMLLQFLLHKYKIKEPITKAEMMKIINKRYKERFPEVLNRVSEHMELVFGLKLQEVDSKANSYNLVSTLEFSQEENMRGGRFPKYGLLMPLLGIIYMHDNKISEEEMWKFLSKLGVHKEKMHFIFGDPKKLLTKDLVQERYLEYRQVPNSDPPCYEFLWGPRAHAEASKTKILAFLTKVQEMDHNAFKTLYMETWREEEEKAAARVWAWVGVTAKAKAKPKASSSRSSRS